MADLSSRPYPTDPTNLPRFRMWLTERGGVVVYENHMFDSSHFGDRSFMPARYIAEDDQMHDAPEERRPNGGLPSLRQQKIDHIKAEDFDSVDECLVACFKDQ